MAKEEGGLKGVTYPLVADTNKTISTNYDVLAGEYDYDEEGNLTAEGEMIAYRGCSSSTRKASCVTNW